jgi:dCTP deaminase
MAIKHKMIEPFEERLVRKGVISYGLSSYGYDMRLADEFLIFTNVWGAIVDPKAFDERAFVRHKGDFCIIPPNSFVLGRSVEYFRIPREVICIVVGKSSYARCFRGDTRVALVDGTAPTLEEMAQRWERGERFFGYSVGPFGRIIVTELVAPRYIGRDSLLEITLDNGQKIHCTPDHLFLTRDGLMVPAADLRPGDRLMPLYRRVFRGYEMVYQPLTGRYYPTHRLADEWNLRHGIYPDLPNTHRHHLDGNRRNNMPCNIVRVPASEHLRHHNATRNFNPERHRLRLLATFAQLRQNPDWWASFCEKQRCQAIRFWQDEKYQAARQALREKRRAYWTEERRQERSVAYRQWWEMNPERRQELVAEFRLQRNHQVVAIRELKGEHDVFCLTVPEAGNFALEAGIFVHNCGIVVNVTPLEPEWEGHVTIEISNTTPLPAKVYANEGIAQVIFLSADELCEVSYADRKGKYQGQQGIVPPKVE